MAGTPHGRLDCKTNRTTSDGAAPGALIVQEMFKTCFDFFAGSSRHTIIARNNGAANGNIPGNPGTGYWDASSARFGNGAFFVVDFVNASARYQMMMALSDANNLTGFSVYGSSNPGCVLGIAMACAKTSGGAHQSAWGGTTNNNGADTVGAPLWALPAGGRIYPFPRANARGGTTFPTNRNNLVQATAFRSTFSNASERFHLIVDDDNWLLASDLGDDGSYTLSAGGVYTPRPDLTVDRPLIMLASRDPSDGFNRYYSSASVYGNPASGGNQYDGGIRVGDELVGVGGAGVGIDVHAACLDDLSSFESAAFQPGRAFNPRRWNEYPHFVGAAENTDGYEYAGQWDWVRSVRGPASGDVNSDKSRAYLGGSTTAAQKRWSVPWDGATTPGTGSSRAGVAF